MIIVGYENGKRVEREVSETELLNMKTEAEQQEKEYWLNADYNELVNAEIRKKYTESQEFAILRQKDSKPEEYTTYYDYCESCKASVKAMLDKYM